MCNCGCIDEVETEFRKVGNHILIIEWYPSCKFCNNKSAILISLMNDNSKKIYKQMGYDLKNIPKLQEWMENDGKPIFIEKMKVKK